MKTSYLIAILFMLVSACIGFIFALLVDFFTSPDFTLESHDVVITGAVLLLMIVSAALLAVVKKLHHITCTLQAVNDGESADPVPVWRVSVLNSLTEQVNTLIDNHQEFQIAKDRLYDQIREVAAGEERKRLARDLHDSIKQQVFSISISAAAAEAHLEQNPVAARSALLDVKQSAQEAMVEMRALLQQLAPAPLEKSGLIDALREQAEALSYRTGAHVKTAFGDLPADDRLPPGTQEAIFRIAQEGFSNIARHARAKQVTLTLEPADDTTLMLHITDDGQGFDVTEAERGMGLNNIERRVRDIPGAIVDLQSDPGNGTDLTITIPLVDPQRDEATLQVSDDTAKSLAETAMRYYWGFAASISAGIFFLSMGLVLLSRASNSIVMLLLFLLCGAMIPAAWWFIKQHRHHKQQMHAVSARYPAAHYLALYTHQADWIVWTTIMFLMPRVLISAGIAPVWATLLGGVCVIAMSAHLGVTEWTRQKYLRALSPEKRRETLDQLGTEVRSGWFIILLMIVTIIVPGTANGVYLLPENADQWASNFFLTFIVIFTGYLIAMTWLYWRWKKKPLKRKVQS
jgi:signal transduction histidine kinase